MKFTSESVTLAGGLRMRIDVCIPRVLLEYDISDDVWQAAIDEFNKTLDARNNITTKINGVDVDVLKVESIADNEDLLRMGSIVILLVVKKEDADKISPLEFCLKGHLTHAQNCGMVEYLTIENILVGDGNIITC